ncbi:hypothetical protein D3C79_933540 [compost metagenome]
MTVKNSRNQCQQQGGSRKPDAVEGKRREYSDGMLDNQKCASPHHCHQKQTEIGYSGAIHHGHPFMKYRKRIKLSKLYPKTRGRTSQNYAQVQQPIGFLVVCKGSGWTKKRSLGILR